MSVVSLFKTRKRKQNQCTELFWSCPFTLQGCFLFPVWTLLLNSQQMHTLILACSSAVPFTSPCSFHLYVSFTHNLLTPGCCAVPFTSPCSCSALKPPGCSCAVSFSSPCGLGCWRSPPPRWSCWGCKHNWWNPLPGPGSDGQWQRLWWGSVQRPQDQRRPSRDGLVPQQQWRQQHLQQSPADTHNWLDLRTKTSTNCGQQSHQPSIQIGS